MPKTKEAPEVIEAEAEIIEDEITPLTGLDSLISEITEEAERLAAEYLPHDIKDEEDFKQSKRERTGARKGITALKRRYDERMGAIKSAVADADLRAKKAIAPLDAIDKGYKLKVDEYTARWVNARVAFLREEYESFAPDLALPQEGTDEALVPFHRLLAHYGNDKGAAWTSRTIGEIKAVEAMQAAVSDIATAEKTIDNMVEETYREGAKARYFRTLDLQATLNEEAEAKAQRERLAKLEAERRERRAAEEDAWLREKAAEPVPENVVRIVAPPSDEAPAIDMSEITPGNTEKVYHDEPIPPAPEPAPVYEPAPMPAPAPAEVAHPWVIAIPSATRTQVLAVRDFLNEAGMTGGKVYSGNLAQAYAKEAANGR